MSITACCTGSQNWDAVHQQDKGCLALPARTGQNRANKLPISNPVGLDPHSAEIACDAHVKHSRTAARHAEIAKETKRINPETRIGATRGRGSRAKWEGPFCQSKFLALDCSYFFFCGDDSLVLTQQELIGTLLLSPTQLTLASRGSGPFVRHALAPRLTFPGAFRGEASPHSHLWAAVRMRWPLVEHRHG